MYAPLIGDSTTR